MLTEVVRTGTGTAAAVDGYLVAGKTGTARKTIEGTQGYKTGAYVASFAGFVPAEHPRFTAMVVLDEPTPIFGGLTSAPVFAKIAPDLLRELQVPPPPADPHLFDGVPHAGATVTTAADEPTIGAGATPTVTTVPAASTTTTTTAPPRHPTSTTTTTRPTRTTTTTANMPGSPPTSAPPATGGSPAAGTVKGAGAAPPVVATGPAAPGSVGGSGSTPSRSSP